MHVFIPLLPTPPSFPNKKTLAKTISFSEPTKPETGGCQTDWINKKPSTTLVQCCVMISLTSVPGNMNLGTGNSHPHASQSARVGRRHMAYVWCQHLIMTMTKKSPAKKSIGKEMAITKKKQQMWKIGKEQKSGKLFDKLIGSRSWVTVTIRRWLWGSLLSLNEVLWPTFQLFFRYLTININGRLWQELGVQHWEIPMEPLTNMAMNNPKRKYWHCGM